MLHLMWRSLAAACALCLAPVASHQPQHDEQLMLQLGAEPLRTKEEENSATLLEMDSARDEPSEMMPTTHKVIVKRKVPRAAGPKTTAALAPDTDEWMSELVGKALPAGHQPRHAGEALPASHFPARAIVGTQSEKVAIQQEERSTQNSESPVPGNVLPSSNLPTARAQDFDEHAVADALTKMRAAQASAGEPTDADTVMHKVKDANATVNATPEEANPMFTPGSSLPRAATKPTGDEPTNHTGQDGEELVEDLGGEELAADEHARMDDIEYDLEREKEQKEKSGEARRVRDSRRIARAIAAEKNDEIAKATRSAKIEAEHDMVEMLLENEAKNMKDYVHLLEQLGILPSAAFEKAKGRKAELKHLPDGVFSKQLEQAIARPKQDSSQAAPPKAEQPEEPAASASTSVAMDAAADASNLVESAAKESAEPEAKESAEPVATEAAESKAEEAGGSGAKSEAEDPASSQQDAKHRAMAAAVKYVAQVFEEVENSEKPGNDGALIKVGQIEGANAEPQPCVKLAQDARNKADLSEGAERKTTQTVEKLDSVISRLKGLQEKVHQAAA